MKNTKSLKKILAVALAVILTFGCTTVAFASEPVIEVSVAGTHKYPAFYNGTNTLYCSEASKKAPLEGMEYNMSSENFDISACDKLFIAEYLIENITEEHVQVVQQLFWGILNNYDGVVAVKRISDTAYEAYAEIKKLMDNIDADDFSVSYVVYETEEAEFQKLVDAIVHKHVAGDVVVENNTGTTCTTDGSHDNVVYCTSCGDELSRETITVSATGHTAAEAVEENYVAPTCTVDGSYDTVIYCSVCDAELARETVTVPATGHNYESVATASTCIEAGAKKFTCTVCGDTYADTIDALGHTEEVIPAVAATCTTAGATAGVKCSVCDAIITAPTTVPALGHTAGDVVVENNVTATCTAAGSYDSVTYCTVCGVETSRNTVTVPATGHTNGAVVVENEKAATCTADGSYDNAMYCTVCGTETSRETAVVPATGHVDGAVVVENSVAPTCTSAGSYDDVTYCTVCNIETSRETVALPATGHAPEAVAGKSPTCTDTGLIEGSKCSVCGKTLTAQSAILATGHSFGEWVVVKEATVEEQGLEERTCSACGLVESRPLDKIEPPAEEPQVPEVNVVVPDYQVPNVNVQIPEIDVPDVNININIENEQEKPAEEPEETVEEIIEEIPTLDEEEAVKEETPDNVLSEDITFMDVEIPNTDAGIGFGMGKLIAALFFTGTGVVACKNKKKKLNGLVDDDEEVDDE